MTIQINYQGVKVIQKQVQAINITGLYNIHDLSHSFSSRDFRRGMNNQAHHRM